MTISVRALKEEDVKKCIELFHDTVHTINSKDYTLEQVDVWAPNYIDHNSTRWQSLLTNFSFVAEMNNKLVGFIDMTNSGYLDRLFVHKDFQGKGIATALLHQLEKRAKVKGISEISTEASITAKHFFEAKGFKVCEEQRKLFNGVTFINYLMKKKIC